MTTTVTPVERLRAAADAPSSEPLLAVEQLVVKYPRFTLGPINLTLELGERVALLGRNGAGKSTLLSLMAGQRHIDSGEVRLTTSAMHADGRLLLRERVAYVGATLQALPWYSVRKHFEFLSHMHPRWHAARAMDLARTLRLDLDATTGTLSRGNLVKVNLCTAWAQGADVLLLDEPTAGLDPIARADMLRELRLFIDAYPSAAVVYATHLLDELQVVQPQRLLVLRDGSLTSHHHESTDLYDPNVLTDLMTGTRHTRVPSHGHPENIA